jgi:hypothetical protein
LLVRHTQRHGFLHLENYNDVILSDPGPERESSFKGISVRGHEKDTTLLGATTSATRSSGQPTGGGATAPVTVTLKIPLG